MGITEIVVMHDLGLNFQGQTFQVTFFTSAEKMQTLLLLLDRKKVENGSNYSRASVNIYHQIAPTGTT